MGNKHPTKVKTLLWNEDRLSWVPTLLVLHKGLLKCYNLETYKFIMGVELPTAYKLFVFGPMCGALNWLPPIFLGSRPESNLLAIPTSAEALTDPKKYFWFFFAQPELLASLFERLINLLEKMKVNRFVSFSPADFMALDSLKKISNVDDFTMWYYESLGSGWLIGEARIWKKKVFETMNDETTFSVDKTSCPDVYTKADWSSPFCTNWDTSGKSLLFNKKSRGFSYVKTKVDSADLPELKWGSNDTSPYRKAACRSTS